LPQRRRAEGQRVKLYAGREVPGPLREVGPSQYTCSSDATDDSRPPHRLTNTAGYPACGFRTWVEDFGNLKVTHIGVLVAVEPAGTSDEVGINVHVAGDGDMDFGAVFSDGKVTDGTSWTPDGASFSYLQEATACCRVRARARAR
jgi:hypothetical protein